MNGYKTVAEVPTRFRDTDAIGHVNNAVYLSYLEVARMEYMRQVCGISNFNGVDFILGRVEIDYRAPVMPGETLLVGIRVSRFGGASFDFEYRLEDKATGRLMAQAKTVQVAFDYKANKVKRVTEEFRNLAGRHDGLS